jgi:DNA-directed RNA polymerase specialized sigma24 family protein
MAAERWTAEDSQERRDRIKATDDPLDEWARWQGVDPLTMSWKHATSFGRMIKPDPRPAREPVDEERAIRTDKVVAKLPGRLRFLVKLHYLDRAPDEAKARRQGCSRNTYRERMRGVLAIVADRLDKDLTTAQTVGNLRHDGRASR